MSDELDRLITACANAFAAWPMSKEANASRAALRAYVEAKDKRIAELERRVLEQGVYEGSSIKLVRARDKRITDLEARLARYETPDSDVAAEVEQP